MRELPDAGGTIHGVRGLVARCVLRELYASGPGQPRPPLLLLLDPSRLVVRSTVALTSCAKRFK
jgi:hypothetical protein